MPRPARGSSLIRASRPTAPVRVTPTARRASNNQVRTNQAPTRAARRDPANKTACPVRRPPMDRPGRLIRRKAMAPASPARAKPLANPSLGRVPPGASRTMRKPDQGLGQDPVPAQTRRPAAAIRDLGLVQAHRPIPTSRTATAAEPVRRPRDPRTRRRIPRLRSPARQMRPACNPADPRHPAPVRAPARQPDPARSRRAMSARPDLTPTACRNGTGRSSKTTSRTNRDGVTPPDSLPPRSAHAKRAPDRDRR